jgi:pentatricopeptide repeat protein
LQHFLVEPTQRNVTFSTDCFYRAKQPVSNSISSNFAGKGPDAALEQVDILKRTGVMPTIHMFNTILKSLIDQNRLDDANKLWIRMHLEDCPLDKEAFTTMLRTCTKTGQFIWTEIESNVGNMVLNSMFEHLQ